MGLEHGSPDLVCLKKGGDTTKRQSILIPIEMKRPVVLESEDLVADYNSQVQAGQATGVVRSVQQEYGYLWCNGYRYGILSSYEQTWVRKERRGKFSGTPGFTTDQSQLFSSVTCGLSEIGRASCGERVL